MSTDHAGSVLFHVSKSDLALSEDYRGKPFPEVFDHFLRVFECVGAWNSRVHKRALTSKENLRRYHGFIDVYASRLVATPGFERLVIVAHRVFGADPDPHILRLIRGRIGRGDVTLNEAADLIEKVSSSPPVSAGTLPPCLSDQASPPDAPLLETVRKLGRATRQVEIIRFLWKREGREADLKTITEQVFKVRPAREFYGYRTARRQLERTRDNLEALGCSLRLSVSRSSVQLVDAQLSPK